MFHAIHLNFEYPTDIYKSGGRSFRRRSQSKFLGLVWKNNLTQQNHTFTNQKKCTTIQNKQKTKARFSCLLQHPAWKWREPIMALALHKFVNLLRRHLFTHLLTVQDPHGARHLMTLLRGGNIVPTEHKSCMLHWLSLFWHKNSSNIFSYSSQPAVYQVWTCSFYSPFFSLIDICQNWLSSMGYSHITVTCDKSVYLDLYSLWATSHTL